MTNRADDLAAIAKALNGAVVGQSESGLVAQGDSLALLPLLPDQAVSLVLCDPPYHSTKKSNITGDRDFEEDEHFLEWLEKYAMEWKRVLKPSGTVYVFCSGAMSARLEVMMSRYFRPIAHVTWSKPNEPGYDGWKGKMNKQALRSWYPQSERILMFEHGQYGSLEAYRRSPMGEYLLAQRKLSGLTMTDVCEIMGEYGKVNRGGAVANWEAGRNIPSRDQYTRLVQALMSTGRVTSMLDYEDLIRPMQVNGQMEFTDVWNFMSVRPFADKHPAEKPQDMLLHMIAASSYPGDIVLDTFGGSGSTGVAAVRLGRRAVVMEIEARWAQRAAREVTAARPGEQFEAPVRTSHNKRRSQASAVTGSLFD